MDDELAFIRAILAAPRDHAPRLVYADWIEERGDAERAEFIRLSVSFMDLWGMATLEGKMSLS